MMNNRPNELCQLASVWRGDMPEHGCIAEEKIDGWRAIYIRDHTGQPALFTRNGHPIEGVGHILHRLGQIEEAVGEALFIDGEFQVDGTLAATKAWCEREWKCGGEAGRFFAFDCMPLKEWQRGGTYRPLVERKAILESLSRQSQGDDWTWRQGSRGRDADTPPALVVLPDLWCADAADVRAEARRVWSRDGEGLMLKRDDSPYRRNRNDAWLKVKQGNAAMAA